MKTKWLPRQKRIAAVVLIAVAALWSAMRGASDSRPRAEEFEVEQAPLTQSAYQVSGNWFNDRGERIEFSSFTGQRAAIALFYTSCRTICPMTVATLKKVEKDLGEKAKDVQFILVSIDPVHDQPAQLTAFVKTHNLDLSRWHVVTAHEGVVRRLAGRLRLGFGHQSPDPDLHFMHSQMFTIVNEDGFAVETISTMQPDYDRAYEVLASNRPIARQVSSQ